VPGYLNITLASNQNNNAATSVSQGSVDPSGATNLFPISDAEGVGNVTTNATTQFIADKNIVSVSKIAPSQIDKLVYDSSSDQLSQDVKTFLAKPVRIMNGVLSSTDTFSTFTPVNNPYSSLVAATMLQDKLRGYLGFRATTVYRIVVNATRFQQGRYNFSYVATGGADISVPATLSWVQDHISTLVQRTTLPHIEIDLNCDTEATMRIPYNSALNFAPIATILDSASYGTLGLAYFYPYVALSDPAGGTCGFAIYQHFEDVELVAAALPQSGVSFSKKSRKNATEVEQDSIGIGPISSSLIKVRDAATILARVPLLSAYAGSVSWFADLGASAAKVFGWRKPIVIKASERITQNYLPYAANTDGPDMSFPLSLSYENSVGIACGFSGTDVDEMDFTYLATIPAWSATIPWTAAYTAGTQLSALYVSPNTSIHTTTVNTATFNHYIPFQFLAQHFNLWRGSLVYKIKLVKTEFHSGRLSIQFSPYNGEIATVAVPTVGGMPYLHRQIIDIRETNEFTFVVPFVSIAPYKKTTDNAEGFTGVLTIVVIEPLVAPAAATQSISVIIEKAAGPDFELAIPENNPQSFFSGITPQSGDVFSSASVGSNACSHFDSTIGTSLVKGDNYLNSLHCIGERISSLRSLLKLPYQLVNLVVPTANLYIHVLPYGISSGTVNGAVNTPPSVLNDFYSRFASLYVYSRGGVRLKYLDNTAVTSPNPIAITLDTLGPLTAPLQQSILTYSATNSSAETFNSRRGGLPVHYYRAGYSGEVQIPQYNQYHSRLNSDCVTNVINPYDSGAKRICPSLIVTRNFLPNVASDAAILRSGADDLNFGGFLSIPPMFFLNSA
jgi:hypothetical protein